VALEGAPLIADADNTQPAHADAPARVVFTFEGTREQLPDDEKLNYDLAKALTGNPLPYATLMYIWEPNRPEGEIVTHYNSSRVKMVIAGNSASTSRSGTTRSERLRGLPPRLRRRSSRA
jgi:hypothetical protein